MSKLRLTGRSLEEAHLTHKTRPTKLLCRKVRYYGTGTKAAGQFALLQELLQVFFSTPTSSNSAVCVYFHSLGSPRPCALDRYGNTHCGLHFFTRSWFA